MTRSKVLKYLVIVFIGVSVTVGEITGKKQRFYRIGT